MSTVNANQVKRIKVMVSERAKECGIIPSVAQEKFKKLVADFYEVETISTKEILAEDYEYLCSLIPLEFVKNEVKKDPFAILSRIDFTNKIDKKGKFNYVSWAVAWGETLKQFPFASYEIKWFDGKPYFVDNFGVTIYTSITIDGLTHQMWLPVMDSSNKAKKAASIDAMDINKTTMRCLTKNLAMFGVGLYVYAGEDLPEIEDVIVEKTPTVQLISPDQAAFLRNEIIGFARKEFPNEDPKTIGKMVVSYLGVNSISDLTASGFDSIARALLTILNNATATLKPELLSIEQLNQLENMLTDFSAATNSPLSEMKSMVLEKLNLKSFSDIKSNDFEEVKDLIESLFEEK